MSAPLARAKAAVMPLLSTAREAIGSRYGKLMADNAQFVVQDKAAEDKLLKQFVFTKLAKIPPMVGAAEAEAAVWKASWDKRNSATMEQCARMALFGTECIAWFAVGEYVGRGFQPAPL